MKTRNAVALLAAGLGVGAAAAGLYRSTHPRDAKGPLSADAEPGGQQCQGVARLHGWTSR
jgi:hypothetical protein